MAADEQEEGFLARLKARIDEIQRSSPVLATPYAVVKKFSEDKGGYLAALIAYYGFFSLFPLLLVFVTVLGYVLSGNPDLQERIVNSTFAQFPVIGDQIRQNVGSLHGNAFALIFGLLAALWAGLGALQALEHAMNSVWDVPIKERPNFLVSKLRAILTLLVFGLGVIAVTILGSAGTVASSLGALATVMGALLSAVLTTGLFLLAFKILTNRDLPWRAHLPGSVVGGVLFTALQLLGGYYVSHTVKGASQTYGLFAVVIGLLSWIFLQAQVAVLAAEVNVVRWEHLWPRSLSGNLTEADRRALAQHAEVEERIEHEDVSTRIEPQPDEQHGDEPQERPQEPARTDQRPPTHV